MTFYIEDYKDDALKISDEFISADWRFGLLRAAAQVIRDGAYPLDSTERFGITVPGSNREHVMGNHRSGDAAIKGCPLVEIYEVQEEQGERYNFSTFGGSTDDVMVLKAKATCKCGQLQKHPVEIELNPGELIYMVMSAE